MEYSNEDAYLLMALRRGEMIAFDSIFKKYYPILCAYGNRFVDYEESKEIAGDAIFSNRFTIDHLTASSKNS